MRYFASGRPEVAAASRRRWWRSTCGKPPLRIMPGTSRSTGPLWRAAYFATLPVREIAGAVRRAGIPCALSYSAGTFVCNDVLYSLLHACCGTKTLAGFIHVPFLPEQAKEKSPSMPEETIVKALTIAVEALP